MGHDTSPDHRYRSPFAIGDYFAVCEKNNLTGIICFDLMWSEQFVVFPLEERFCNY